MEANPLSVDVLRRRLTTPEDCVLPTMLDRQAERLGDQPLVIFDEGPTWSYKDTRDIACGTAAALQELGVKRGDRVLVWLNDGPMIIRVSLALWYMGAIFVPMNPEYRGSVLNQTINYAEASLLIAESELLNRVEQASYPSLQTIVVCGDLNDCPDLSLEDIEILEESVLSPYDKDMAPLTAPIQPWDIHTIFFTSGTTGVSKGVECSHVHCATMAIDGLRFLNPTDRFVTPCGYFHVGGAYAPWAVINKGASMVVVGRFSATKFWDQIRKHRATIALMIGVMCDFLMSRDEQPGDADTSLRLVIMQPLLKNVADFMQRFGVEVYTQYDQTETSPPMTSDLIDPSKQYEAGYCGRARPGFDLKLVDENDCDVPVGHLGELVLRCDVPWVIADKYFNKPEQTAKAWRNGWYHTGDIFRCDEAGNYYFVDRSKDVIRRRGENISSFEIEQELVVHPSIAAAAAYGVASEHSESEVMVALEASPGYVPNLEDLADFVSRRVPGFMVPRYFRVMESLPRSATDKVRKPDLQSEGVTQDTWDRLAPEQAQ